MEGRVIGVVSYMISQTGGYEGLAFVITSNVARRVLLETPSLWSGIQGQLVSGELTRIFNVPQSAGMLVQRVALLSPAYRLGIRRGKYRATIEGEELSVGGDIVLSVAGIEITESNYGKIIETLREMTDDDVLKIEVLRGGQVLVLSSKLGKLRPKRP